MYFCYNILPTPMTERTQCVMSHLQVTSMTMPEAATGLTQVPNTTLGT